jgi:hypothetical protein
MQNMDLAMALLARSRTPYFLKQIIEIRSPMLTCIAEAALKDRSKSEAAAIIRDVL